MYEFLQIAMGTDKSRVQILVFPCFLCTRKSTCVGYVFVWTLILDFNFFGELFDVFHPHRPKGRADYHGSSINRAARYMDAGAHGGQVVCEEALAIKYIQVRTISFA